MTGAQPEFSRPVPVRDLPDEGRAFRFEATETERAAIARRLGLIGVESLVADFTVKSESGGVWARGRFEATVVQQCVVTLEPLTNRVEGDIAQRFAPESGEPAEEVIFDALADDPPEPLSGAAAELGELVVEHLSLALDPYPRAQEAEAALPHEDAAAAVSPFAKLRDMKFSATEE